MTAVPSLALAVLTVTESGSNIQVVIPVKDPLMRPAREEQGGLRNRDQIETSKEKGFRDEAKEGDRRGFIIDRKYKARMGGGLPQRAANPRFLDRV